MNHPPDTTTPTPRERGREDVPAAPPEDLTTALLDPAGGAGAELHGHVPDAPRGVVLILHGGAERSRMPVAWWRLPVLRMVPFASTISRRAGDDLAVLRLAERFPGLTQPDPSYHGAVYTQAVGDPLAYIIKARVQLLRDLGASNGADTAFWVAAGLLALCALIATTMRSAARPPAAVPDHPRDAVQAVQEAEAAGV